MSIQQVAVQIQLLKGAINGQEQRINALDTKIMAIKEQIEQVQKLMAEDNKRSQNVKK